MNRGSAFARVIGLTKSLSPFERGQAEEADRESVAVPPDAVEALGAVPFAAAAPLESDKAEAAADPQPPTVAPPNPADVLLAAAMARVTVVAGEIPAVAGAPRLVAPEAVGADDVDEVRDAVTDQAIDAIENDIASLLTSLEEVDRMRHAGVADDGDETPPAGARPAETQALDDLDAHGADEAGADGAPEDHDADDHAAEEPTFALLSELDRMWRADPMVGSYTR